MPFDESMSKTSDYKFECLRLAVHIAMKEAVTPGDSDILTTAEMFSDFVLGAVEPETEHDV